MNSVSERIRYYRRKMGLTQQDVASALEIRTDNYTKYESGARIPRDERLIKLAKILGVSYNALNEGIEQEFVGLLSRHAINAVLGDMESFEAFASDMELSREAYDLIADFFVKGTHYFAANDPELYTKHMAQPNLTDLIALYDIYKERFASRSNETNGDDTSEMKPDEIVLKLVTPRPHKAAKWAFFVAVSEYMKRHDTESILREAGTLSGNLDALQFFAVKVFVPHLSFIIEAVELCTNTTVDDFEKSFLFDVLTPSDDENERDDGEDD